MSLADDFLADFEDDADEELEGMVPNEAENDEIEEIMEVERPVGVYDKVTDVAKLKQSDRFVFF